jgi:hypothetical protein
MANQRHVFIHIGDTHIVKGDRLADKLASLTQIIVWAEGAAARGELAAILWPGDLFHAARSADDRIFEENTLIPVMMDMANLAPVVVVYGNHDAPGSLDIFRSLSTKHGIVIVDRPQTIRVECATGIEATIFCLPYPHKAGLVGAGVEHDALGQAARSALEPAFAVAAEELRQARGRGAIPMFVGHVNVGGSISSTGQPQIGREIELDPGLLGRLDAAVYKGLNHIHKHQVVAGDTVYAGSICRQDFGENEAKGFVAITDTADGCSWEFIPLDVPAQHLVEGRLTREGFTVTAVNGDEDGEFVDSGYFVGADVKVRYHYKRSEHSALDVAHIYATFAGCRSLKLDQIAEIERDVRAPEIAAAVTVDAKGEAYCTRRNIPWTPTIAAKLTGLQQQPAEAILAELQSFARDAGTVTPEARRAVA